MKRTTQHLLEDTLIALTESANIKREIEQPRKKENDDEEIVFMSCVAFLDLIRKGRALSNDMEGGLIMCASLKATLKELAEVLGCEGSDGMNILENGGVDYMDYLEPLVSNYKAARSSNPTGGYGDEGIRRFDGYHGDGNKDGSTAAKEKGIVKHFGITLLRKWKACIDATEQR
ncbi:hypothetical protein Tco_1386756 [Tanacetum coccineum]